MNRARLRPWGVAGGHPGYLGGAILNPGMPGEQRIAKITVLSLKRGDVVRLTTPAGGGFGDPFEREPERVLADVRGGWLSVEAAGRDYGVAIIHGQVDLRATREIRERGLACRSARGGFSKGAARGTYDNVWPPEYRGCPAGVLIDWER